MACACVKVVIKTLLTSLFLLHRQGPACLVRLQRELFQAVAVSTTVRLYHLDSNETLEENLDGKRKLYKYAT